MQSIFSQILAIDAPYRTHEGKIWDVCDFCPASVIGMLYATSEKQDF